MTSRRPSTVLTRLGRSALVLICLVGLFVAVRCALQPEDALAPPVHIDPELEARLRSQIRRDAKLDVTGLARALQDAEVVLVGEVHHYNEPLAYLTRLLDEIHGRSFVLMLELPRAKQPLLDRYLQTGDEADLEAIWQDQDALPYQAIVRWAHARRETVHAVVAMDEDPSTIMLRRAFLTDTRNETMARAVLDARSQFPDALVVAYGGQLHMMKAGRYRYDSPSRVPLGARLLKHGLSPSAVVSVMIGGSGTFSLHALWEHPGALPMTGLLADLPPEYFLGPYKIFRVTRAGELFDYYVNVGPLTDCAR